jgi:hypothetical protein
MKELSILILLSGILSCLVCLKIDIDRIENLIKDQNLIINAKAELARDGKINWVRASREIMGE